MRGFESRLGVYNSRENPQVIAVEPWADDFTLLPGEGLEIVAFGADAPPSFHLVEWDDTTQVYCNDALEFAVFQGDQELKCGHQRQV